jgi:hypothetical protein
MLDKLKANRLNYGFRIIDRDIDEVSETILFNNMNKESMDIILKLTKESLSKISMIK